MGSFCSLKSADKPVVSSYVGTATGWQKHNDETQGTRVVPASIDVRDGERLTSACKCYLTRKRFFEGDVIDFPEDETLPPQRSSEAVSDPQSLLTTKAFATLTRLPPFTMEKQVIGVFPQGPRLLADDSIYVGEWSIRSNGTAIKGKGTLYHKNGAYSQGYWKDGRLFYRGRFISASGDLYEGHFDGGKLSGIGTFESYDRRNIYAGHWRNGKRDGYGQESFPNESTYTGQYVKNHRHGKGTIKWKDNSKYEGEFQDDQITGFGTFMWADGRTYTGDVVVGKMHGQGTFTYPDGKTYTGDYVHDKKSGRGVYRWEGKEYNGEWKDGQMHGIGYLTIPGKGTRMCQYNAGTRVREIVEEN